MTTFPSEAINALRSHKNKSYLGCESLSEEIHTLHKDVLKLSRLSVDALGSAGTDVDSPNMTLYDRESIISKLDRAATELALTQGNVNTHRDVFDQVLDQVGEASNKLIGWEVIHRDRQESENATPDDEGENGAIPQKPAVPDITELYTSTLQQAVPELTKKSRATILKKSRDLKKHRQTLLWMYMPEVDLSDADKWWISLGRLVWKHAGREDEIQLDAEPNGYGLSDEDDDDDLFVSRKTNLKCPITGDYLENPVRAIVCRHLFSGDAFREWLKQNQGRGTCPVAGCTTNLRRITDVEADEDVVGRVRRLKRKEEMKRRERRDKETQGTQRI
ncbi:hypothetical protein CJU90_3325 [Yarrowia sp. C11]|nr:hypothetical protein CKK34_4771 [Yarrowia sp. E02]KAG5369795.1 hypothetical protein CJU90_3325 [Yarrowia sp. C11]